MSAYIGIIIMCFLIAFGGFVFGFDTGTISGFINMSDFLERFGGTKADGTLYFSNVRTGLMIGLFNAGCAIGALFLSKVGDMYGRRVGIMTAMIVYIVGIIVQIASQHAWYQVMIGRIITGLAVGMLSVLCPCSFPKFLQNIWRLWCAVFDVSCYCTTYGTKSYSD